jgi:hypothetical protein
MTCKLTMVLFSTLALAACGKDPFAGQSSPTPPNSDAAAPGPPVDAARSTGTYAITIAPNRMLDLVFMIDNSPSMTPKVVKLDAQFPKLIAALKDPSDGTLPDLRVAIIDSDLGTGGQYSSGSCGPKTLPSDGTVSIYGDLGRFQMIGAANCGVTSPSATYLETKGNVGLNFTGDISTVFACLSSNLGTMGCGEEHPLQAFEFALVAAGLGPTNDAQHLMLRPNAYLGLVILTDEDDCSAALSDGMFGSPPQGPSGLQGESASLRCYTRSHQCNGTDLTESPPGYPTTAAFTAPLTSCSARSDACPNVLDGTGMTDTSEPTSCSPLRDYKKLAEEIKSLKADPDHQILVAGIFGWPLTDADLATAQYKIDLVPNPNTADTAHPAIFDSWPICYDPNHLPANDLSAAGFGATAGLRVSAIIDEFAPNGLKFSICQPDFSASMKLIGDGLFQQPHRPCISDKLVDTDPVTPGLQADCTVNLCQPSTDPTDLSKGIYSCASAPLPACPAGATQGGVAADCWQIDRDLSQCPASYNGQLVTVLRSAQSIAAVPTLVPGTRINMQCKICPAPASADPTAADCNW